MLASGAGDHLAHILAFPAALLVAGGIIAGLVRADRRRARRLGEEIGDGEDAGLMAAVRTPTGRRSLGAGASAGAGFVHGTACVLHLSEGVAFGVFFFAAAGFQMAWAVKVRGSPTRRTLVLGAAVNATLVVVWVVTRTVGLPFGPDAGDAEPAGLLDGTAVLLELAVVYATLMLSRGEPRAHAPAQRLRAVKQPLS